VVHTYLFMEQFFVKLTHNKNSFACVSHASVG
jgi:hypothetical protein